MKMKAPGAMIDKPKSRVASPRIESNSVVQGGCSDGRNSGEIHGKHEDGRR